MASDLLIERLDSTDPRHRAADPWTTTYAVTGRRITGTVEVAPRFNAHGWEFMPTDLHVAYGWDKYSRHVGTLHVNGIQLEGALHMSTKTPPRWALITIRRVTEGSYGEAPDATQRRSREILQAVVQAHVEDEQHAYEKAAQYARHLRAGRLHELRASEREALRALREAQAAVRTASARIDELEENFDWVLGLHAPQPTIPAVPLDA
ncbi:hypothetical protein [Streptomyces cinnamoneus]|uniref:hypothetical protein n=1 Tax=Streptomyces cinnamoneus TaxID=53446 RepID=UPI000CEE66BA|nr:hypothetical protein [Streptomyces cinnamoneus]PPT14835.1 hypothetical protein CYQ11_19940 [Streptomyces cinnamoneus]